MELYLLNKSMNLTRDPASAATCPLHGNGMYVLPALLEALSRCRWDFHNAFEVPKLLFVCNSCEKDMIKDTLCVLHQFLHT